MILLLDTHVLLWFLQDHLNLPEKIRDMIIDPENAVNVSIASYWEIGIKQQNKPASMPWLASLTSLEELAQRQNIDTLPINTEMIERLKTLSNVHRDPFDRIIASSALTAGMRLVSADTQMDDFVTDRIWG